MKYSMRHLLYTTIVMLSIFSMSSLFAAEKTWQINFNNVEVKDLILFVGKATEKTIIIDPTVKGKVTVISQEMVNEKDLYQLFLSILEVHGYAAIESGNVIRVIPNKESPSIAPTQIKNNGDGENNREVITQIIPLENVSANKLLPQLKPLLPAQAHISAYQEGNSLIIADTAANIYRIQQIIKQLDTANEAATDIIDLHNAAADEVVAIIEKLDKSNPNTKDNNILSQQVTLVADKRTNKILVNGNLTERQRVIDLIRHLDSPLVNEGNARVFYLLYARAKELAPTLSNIIKNINDDKNHTTNIEADEATNSLIVTANSSNMQSIESLIQRLDIRRAQVLIEAIIVEIEDNGAEALGIEWLFKNNHDTFGSSIGNNGSLAGDVINSALNPNSIVTDFSDSLSATVGETLGVGRVTNSASFLALLTALNQQVGSNILSTPSLLTLDNSEAIIKVGQEVPFVTGSYTTSTGDASNPFQTIERESVGIQLTVTPQISAGDLVSLKILQEVSSLTGTESSDLITNERSIASTVLAKDGEIIALGGLIKDNVQENVKKIPLLGDMPLIGALFRKTNTSVTKTNLMVFIRPTIIRDDMTMNTATKEKYNTARDAQLKKIEKGTHHTVKSELPLLPEWKAELKKIGDEQDNTSNE